MEKKYDKVSNILIGVNDSLIELIQHIILQKSALFEIHVELLMSFFFLFRIKTEIKNIVANAATQDLFRNLQILMKFIILKVQECLPELGDNGFLSINITSCHFGEGRLFFFISFLDFQYVFFLHFILHFFH